MNANAPAAPPFKHSLKRFLLHVRRNIYQIRAFIPGLRERHRLEKMVGPLGFWKELQKYHLEILTKNGLKPEHKLLDMGCGPLLGGIAFIRYLNIGNYVGLDISPASVEAGDQQIKKLGLGAKKPRVFVSNDFGEKELGAERFDFIWASQMLYYFNDEKLGAILRVAGKHLAPGGKFLGDVFELDHYEFKFPELGGYIRHTPESMEKVAAQNGLKARLLGTIEEFGYPKRLSLRKNLLFEITAR